MKDQFVTFNIALKLKELGFDEECLAYYTHPDKNQVFLDKDGNKTRFVLLSRKIRGELVGHGSVRNRLFKWLLDNDKTYGELHILANSITAPLWQQAIEWLRQKHNYHISIYGLNNKWCGDVYDVLRQCHATTNAIDGITFDRYEEAREAAILKALELIK